MDGSRAHLRTSTDAPSGAVAQITPEQFSQNQRVSTRVHVAVDLG